MEDLSHYVEGLFLITISMDVLYEDNHLIIINKKAGEITQGDKTGDTPLPDLVKLYLKEKYNKPGNVFCGVAHRLDRPTSGVIVFAKTSKALSRMNELFRKDDVTKTYWAIVAELPKPEAATLKHYLWKNEQQNKSYAFATNKEKKDSKLAVLNYKVLVKGDNYNLLEVDLETGRHHQIRCQLASINCPIKGDLKYGAKRSNPDGSISLHARSISFIHPVSKEEVSIIAPVPEDNLWKALEEIATK